MSKELKIGLIATFLIALLIWGFNFLKGKNIFADKNQFYAVYNEIGGLEEASPVYLSGYEVGMVENIKLTGTNMKDLLVRFTIRKDLKIPKNSRCIIYNTDLMGTKAIKLNFTEAEEYYEPGDTLPSGLEPNITEQIYTEIQPLKIKTRNLLASIDSITRLFDGDTKENIQRSIANLHYTTTNLKNTSESLDQLISQNNKKIKKTIDNAESITTNLKNNNEAISNALGNISSVTDSLRNANLVTTLGHLENTLSSTDSILKGIQKGEGSLGRLTKDDSLYIHLDQTTHNLNSLVKDIQENPGKYIQISVFGKNK
ncbi:MAG: MlaD family protein [Bacteroidales bacterium]|nr:MCE family protein [Bacteroidales bacterium]MBS3774541.1 MCE family protein [Bacteroidales bacterium]